jgi:hypothetical protein
MWPLYFHEVRRVPTPEGPKVVRTTEVLYPIFTREATEEGSWYAVRPLYNYDYKAAKDQHRVQYLWPLGLHFKDRDKETHSRLFPVYEYERIWVPSSQRYSVHAHVLELIRWGNDDQWGPYFAIFPLGGVMHDVLGDTWSFVLFPLYSHYRQGNYVRDDFPWPVLGYGRTVSGLQGPPAKRRMYRFFPLYAYQRAEGPGQLFVRHDLIWPLVRWGRVDRGGDRYFTILAVAPFYSGVETRDRSGKVLDRRMSVLGVSFGHSGTGTERTGGWSALWSLFRGTSESKVDESRFLPFYWRRIYYPDRQNHPELRWKRVWAPWPIVHLDSDQRDPKHWGGGVVVAPFYWQYSDTYFQENQPPRERLAITLWPLWTWERTADGGHHFWILSHGWRDLTQGFKRNYGAFFDIFQYHHTPQEREVRLVDRLYHQRGTPQGHYFSLAFLFTYDGTGEVVGQDGSYISFLFDLVKCSWTEKGHRWRLFFIPL